MKKISRRKFIQSGILASIGLILLDSLWFEKYVIDWNYFDISKGTKPKVKIIQISDLHLDSIRSFHRSIAEKINNLQPDFIFITGDSVDKTEKIGVLEGFLKMLDISILKIAILGNWEYWGKVNISKLTQAYQKYNCELLIDKHKSLSIKERKITIIGLDDLIGGTPDFKAATENIPESDLKIVLAHCPQHRDLIQKEKANFTTDLILSGHTHGGQVNIFGFVPFKPQGSGKYLKGWYSENDPVMYVSKGIGTSMLPIRFGARAEVVEIDI
ncbi:MAG TPA: metallophosphoesterase [Salinimicrobium sp.]|nr:metallophosphoesterase [Salinimicrobium sp.]